MPKPHNTDEPEPSTYFEIEQARLNNPGESGASGTVHQLPPLPASSPWGSGPAPGDELPIDRSEDAATGGPNILEVDQ
jgi:hypothetical protein